MVLFLAGLSLLVALERFESIELSRFIICVGFPVMSSGSNPKKDGKIKAKVVTHDHCYSETGSDV